MSPQRVQMSRQRPWRAEHPDAVICDRRTPYGNPFRVEKLLGGEWAVTDPDGETWATAGSEQEATEVAIALFVKHTLPMLDLEPLRGRDLCCWCKLTAACHVDPILVKANGGEA
jgi:hypothetical protein